MKKRQKTLIDNMSIHYSYQIRDTLNDANTSVAPALRYDGENITYFSIIKPTLRTLPILLSFEL